MNNVQERSGFTLVELAIVLVIIGLIVGAVMVGQDMLRAGAIHQQVKQLEQFDVAAVTFREKYGGIPGDITQPSRFGLFEPAGAGGLGLGNGNALIESQGQNTTAGGRYFTGEMMMFWQHLSQAQLVSVNYSDDALNGAPFAQLGVSFPASKMYPDMGIQAFAAGDVQGAAGSKNYFYLGGRTTTADLGNYEEAADLRAFWVRPLDAYAIDLKMDDGAPLTGRMQARYATVTIPNQISPGDWSNNNLTYSCTTTMVASTALYVRRALPSNRGCGLRIAMSI